MSSKGYEVYENVSREILDSVKVGDKIKCNLAKKPSTVVGVSENYFVMIQKNFGLTYYSVCEKKRVDFGRRNFEKDQFRIGPDFWIFGFLSKDFSFDDNEQYRWNDENWIKEYLQSFEEGISQLSERKSIGVGRIEIKRK